MTAADPTSSPRSLGIIGVPTSAGSHNAGQDKAPGAVRAAGLVDQLARRGLDVRDFGDLPIERHRASPKINGVRDLERVAGIARRSRERVAEVAALGRLPLVLGGDCTITLGVVAGLAHTGGLGLMYVDGDGDLSIPETSKSGILDTMGMTHLLGGGMSALSGLGPHRCLVRPEQVSLFGFDPAELDVGQWDRLSSQRLDATPAATVRADPAGSADAAWERLEARVDSILVHFDVDVLDTGEFPLANFPHFAGLTLDQASTCLRQFCRRPKFAGLVVTEVNPDHDPDGTLVAALVETLVDALAPSSTTIT